MTSTQSNTVVRPSGAIEGVDRLQIEFLFLDLETCERCRGTDRSLEAAIDLVGETLLAAGVGINVTRTQVESVEQARELRFESSPTIRVGGSDVALELRESSCGSEACTDGCGESIACRVWVYQGREYTEPPVAMIVDAILREIYSGGVVEREAVTERYELPANLARFFNASPKAEVTEAPNGTACCSPARQTSCCANEDKDECCGSSAGETCGCQ